MVPEATSGHVTARFLVNAPPRGKDAVMFEAQMLFKGCTVYSPWFPRRGDNVIITLDFIARSGTTVAVSLFTKNTEDPGDGGLVAGGPVISTTSLTQTPYTQTGELLELVRYQFEVTGTNAYDWALFRMLPPVWFDTVKA